MEGFPFVNFLKLMLFYLFSKTGKEREEKLISQLDVNPNKETKTPTNPQHGIIEIV